MMDIKIHNDDLPSDLDLGNEIAIDTEAMGLEPKRDPLTLVQISTGNNDCHIVRLNRKNYNAINLVKILENEKINKIFHFARFDVAALKHFLKLDEVDAAVVLGVIEKGETMHGEIMGHSVVNTILSLQLEFMKPIGVGIIGPGVNDTQIEERIVPYARNAVKAVVSMLSLGS